MQRFPVLLLSLAWAAPAGAAPPKLGVGSALDALGGLRGPLEAQGWSLTTDRSSAISPGDIYDAGDHQVQVLGEACFGHDRVRTGLAPSMELDRALEAKGRVRFGFWGIGASADASIDARISRAEVAEIAVADLQPSEACARQIQALTRSGADVSDWYVVQSTLVTDLEIHACAGGEAGVSAGPSGEVSVGAEDCRKTSGTSVVLAIRPEPLLAVLATARIPLPAAGAPPPRRKRREGPPCWLDEPCPPYMEPAFAVAVGRGATMGAADNAARAALLEPFEQHRAGVRALLGQDATLEPELAAESAVTVADRFKDDTAYHSLLALDRAGLQARLEAQATLAQAALAAPERGDPVAEVRALARSLPTAEQLTWWQAELAALRGDEPSVSPFAERVARYRQALGAIAVRPPPGPAGEAVAEALERAGFRPGTGDLAITVAPGEPKERAIQGFTTVTRAAALELRAGERLLGAADAEASASSGDPKRARADAEAALRDRVAELSVQLVRDALR